MGTHTMIEIPKKDEGYRFIDIQSKKAIQQENDLKEATISEQLSKITSSKQPEFKAKITKKGAA